VDLGDGVYPRLFADLAAATFRRRGRLGRLVELAAVLTSRFI
jgi:hypothetical protein